MFNNRAMSLIDKIDKSVWIEKDKFWWSFLEWKIYSHFENDWNNWDKFLVYMFCDSQPFAWCFTEKTFHNWINWNYSLWELEEESEIIFIIVGNLELSEFLTRYEI